MTAQAVERSTVLTDVGRETAKQLTEAEAIELTAQIRVKVEETLPLIRRAFQCRADLAMGYSSWDAYCDAEFSGLRLSVADRPGALAALRSDGMSVRAIGSALGMSKSAVARELATVPGGTVPDRVTGTDGKGRPATRPAAKPKPAPEPDITPDVLAKLRNGGPGGVPVGNIAFLLDTGKTGHPTPERVAEVLHALADDGRAVIVGVTNAGPLWALAELLPVETPEPAESLSTAPAGSGSTSPEPERHLSVVPNPPTTTPPPGSPATWTDAEVEANKQVAETRRMRESGRRKAGTLVTSVIAEIYTVTAAVELGEHGLVTADMVAQLREAVEHLAKFVEVAE